MKISGHDHRATINDAISKSAFIERWPPPEGYFHIHIDILTNDHFFSLGLIAPPNLVVIAALLVADVLMTAAILLKLELDLL